VPEAEAEVDERELVHRRRFDEAFAAGLVVEEALRFADSDVDIGDLRRLVLAGCPPELIVRILL
jgi:hypothetical protein